MISKRINGLSADEMYDRATCRCLSWYIYSHSHTVYFAHNNGILFKDESNFLTRFLNLARVGCNVLM